MLKLRLKRGGRKRQPSYRLVVMENTARREGRPVDEVGYYNPITKQSYFNAEKGNNIQLNPLLKILDGLNITLEDFFKGLE